MESNTQKNGMAVAGLILGIVSVVFSFIITWVGLVTGIIGIICSAKGMKIQVKKGMAVAGLVCSIIGTSISGIMIACALCIVGTVSSAIGSL